MNPRRGRTLAVRAAAGLLLLLALAAVFVMQPGRLARLVLGTVGDGLGLEIGFSGDARYRLRGTPLLEVHELSVRAPGDPEPLLRASRALVSLPWSTVRARGAAPLTLERVELDAPVLDLPRLQAWLAARPPGDRGLPTLRDGLQVDDGQVLGAGWTLRGLHLALPRFAPAAPLRADARGEVALDALTLGFDLGLAATRAGRGASVAARGRVHLQGDGWRLPARVAARGPVTVREGGWWVAPLRFGAAGAWQGDGAPVAFVAGAHGPFRLRGGTATLAPMTLVLRGEDLVPGLTARGRAALGPALLLEAGGTLAAWPAGWPTLPPPLDRREGPWPFGLAYAGPPDLGGPVHASLRRHGARADASARVRDLLAWLDRDPDAGAPLPPLRARASVPRLEVAGAVLEGVEVELEPEAGE